MPAHVVQKPDHGCFLCINTFIRMFKFKNIKHLYNFFLNAKLCIVQDMCFCPEI